MKKRNNYQKPASTKVDFHTSPCLQQSVHRGQLYGTIEDMNTFLEEFEGPPLDPNLSNSYSIDDKNAQDITFQ